VSQAHRESTLLTMTNAAQRWRDELAAWAIDPEILARAPQSPWEMPPAAFPADDRPPLDAPSRRRALDALPPGGSVLDVGCGAGAAGLALAPPAALLVGVDQSARMLAAFSQAAHDHGVAHETINGRWPDVESQAPEVDVAVAHHVAYNVADLPAFAHALSRHARRRVVLELTDTHPLTFQGPLWRHFHGQPRPTGPAAELARDVLAEAALPVRLERSTAPARNLDPALRARLTRIRLCLPADREAEVAELLAAAGPAPTRNLVTLFWDTPGG
jgi:SAM-dependent methyltransferase